MDRPEQGIVFEQMLVKVEEKASILKKMLIGDWAVADVQALLEKQGAFEMELSVHRDEINELASNADTEQVQRVIVLQENLDRMESLATKPYLQFWSTAYDIEAWITEKETHVRTGDYPRDPIALTTLLTKQDTFDAALNAFESEGIANIENLKDQLIESNHVQSGLISKRFEDVVTRWKNLKAASRARKTRLFRMQPFRP